MDMIALSLRGRSCLFEYSQARPRDCQIPAHEKTAILSTKSFFYDAGVGPVTDVVPKEGGRWFDFNSNMRRMFNYIPSNAVGHHRHTLYLGCSVTFLLSLLFCQTAETQLGSWLFHP
jgi:hypothetical protein